MAVQGDSEPVYGFRGYSSASISLQLFMTLSCEMLAIMAKYLRFIYTIVWEWHLHKDWMMTMKTYDRGMPDETN